MDASFWAGFDEPTAIATLVAGVIGAIAVLIATGLSNMFLKKQNQVQGLLESLRLLDSNEHRVARETAYFDFFEFRKNKNLEVFANPHVGQVMADFDVIGRLVRSKNIGKNDFFNLYGSLAYRCWRILEKHIKEERGKSRRDFPKFMDNFEWLANEGYKYWDRQGYDIKKTRLYNPKNHEESVDFQQEFW